MSKTSAYFQEAKERMESDLESAENFLKKCTVFGDYKNINAGELTHRDIQFLCWTFSKDIVALTKAKRDELVKELKRLTDD